ncbi:DUF1294 domain-containing protein [Clostridium aestuarii]|uniref:DUF1294 domain-containing protein n=1 Tax=Clostridium aestuarii TaxID=338193 RepID=A0ABT4D1J6_9CLOT|nr:DUF1294 domain-containing protein [Clostridium aestuarii]MCY6485117.1 DUF1294 domain-containing protein [Clostridium aestuarii]
MNLLYGFYIYLIIINLYGVIIMYSDKRKAKRGDWRIPEAKLFKTALIFGSVGIMLGMRLFRHKTKHFKFVYGIPIILFIQIYLIYRLRVF